MKTLNELEREAYIAGALLMADLYARTKDAEAHNCIAFQAQVYETEKLKELLEDSEEDLQEAETEVFKLKGRVEVLEFEQWRLEQLEK